MKHATILTLVILAIVGVAPGHTFAAPLGIGTCRPITASGSYVVTRNLTAVGTCLSIRANFVTIDLGGFTLTGNGTGEGVSDLAGPALPRGITVRNGKITNFRTGVYLTALGSVIERVQVIDNTGGGIVTGSKGGMLVSDNIAYHNGLDGISVSMLGVIVNNVSSNNGDTTGFGSGIVAGYGSTVIGNTSARNAQYGFVLSGEGTTLANNTARVNELGNILARCPANVTGNTATAFLGGLPNLVFLGAGCNNSNNVAP